MAAPTLTRVEPTDDDGSGTTGTVINKAWVDSVYDSVDALSAALYADMATVPVTVPNGGTGATTLTGLVKGNGASAMTAVTAPSGAVVGTSDTQTLSNKRTTPRVTTITSSATPAVNTDTTDFVNITAIGTAITSMTSSLSGTPVIGDKLIYQIKDDATARAITWGASFVAKGVALPTTTVISKLLTVGFICYDGTHWGCVAVSSEA